MGGVADDVGRGAVLRRAGPAQDHGLSGGSWSTALVPLALLLLAAAVAALAVRGWPLRVLAVLVAAASAGMAYLAISLWVIRDVAVRAAASGRGAGGGLVGTQRHYGGAVVTLVAAVCTLAGAVLLMRSAAKPSPRRPATSVDGAPVADSEARRRHVRADDLGCARRGAATRPIRTTRVGDEWRGGGYPSMKIKRAHGKDSDGYEFGNRARLHHRGSPRRRCRS